MFLPLYLLSRTSMELGNILLHWCVSKLGGAFSPQRLSGSKNLCLFLFYSCFWNFSNAFALIFIQTMLLLRTSKTEPLTNSRLFYMLKCLAWMTCAFFFPGRFVGMTEWKGWPLSGNCLDKNAVYIQLFYLPQILLSARRDAGVGYC